MTHTPGPWEIRDFGHAQIGIFAPNSPRPDADLAKVYLVDPVTRKRTPEFRGNASLIIAAPAMKDRLHSIDRWMSGYGTKDQHEIANELRQFLNDIGFPTPH